VVPDEFAERLGDAVKLGPEHRDPPPGPVLAHPDPGHIVGVSCRPGDYPE
jgi:hypothetical protein